MQKVVYSVSKLNRFGNTKMTGVGFITENDLITACVSKKGYPRIRGLRQELPCRVRT